MHNATLVGESREAPLNKQIDGGAVVAMFLLS
jgi:hypothetical protein